MSADLEDRLAVALSEPLPCPTCKTAKHVKTTDSSGWGDFLTTCDNCYDADCVGDPPEFVSRNIHGWGKSRAGSVDNWNEEVECAS